MLRHQLHLAPPLMLSLLERGAFAMYWNSASKEASPAAVSEPTHSRRPLLLLLNLAFAFTVVPIPWSSLKLSAGHEWLSWSGLALQFASIAIAIWARYHLAAQWSDFDRDLTDSLIEHSLVDLCLLVLRNAVQLVNRGSCLKSRNFGKFPSKGARFPQVSRNAFLGLTRLESLEAAYQLTSKLAVGESKQKRTKDSGTRAIIVNHEPPHRTTAARWPQRSTPRLF